MEILIPKKQIKAIYGHKYTLPEIKSEFPYSNKTFNQTVLPQNIIVTYNPMQAVQLRANHTCIGWGLRDKGRNVFVFKKNSSDPLKVEINL